VNQTKHWELNYSLQVTNQGSIIHSVICDQFLYFDARHIQV